MRRACKRAIRTPIQSRSDGVQSPRASGAWRFQSRDLHSRSGPIASTARPDARPMQAGCNGANRTADPARLQAPPGPMRGRCGALASLPVSQLMRLGCRCHAARCTLHAGRFQRRSLHRRSGPLAGTFRIPCAPDAEPLQTRPWHGRSTPPTQPPCALFTACCGAAATLLLFAPKPGRQAAPAPEGTPPQNGALTRMPPPHTVAKRAHPPQAGTHDG